MRKSAIFRNGELSPQGGFPPKRHAGFVSFSEGYTFITEEDLANPSDEIISLYPRIRRVTKTNELIKLKPKSLGYNMGSGGTPLSLEPYIQDISGLYFGISRSHDRRWCNWAQTETSKGVYNWDALDKWADFYNKGIDLLFTFYQTPTWASARPNDIGPYTTTGWNAEPTNMQDAADFAITLARRMIDRGTPIKYWEIFNEPNYGGVKPFYSGTKEKLSEMTRVINRAIKSVDPTAKIVCSSVTAISSVKGVLGSGETYFIDMMKASDGATGTMRDWVDIIGFHDYCAERSPVNMHNQIMNFKSAVLTAGVSGLPLWDTETGMGMGAYATKDRKEDYRLLNQMSQWLILSVACGIERMFWYQLGNPDIDSTYSILGRSSIFKPFAELTKSLEDYGVRDVIITDNQVRCYINNKLLIV